MLPKISALILLVCLALRPDSVNSQQSVAPDLFLGTSEGLFQSAGSSSQLVKVSGFQTVTNIGYNRKAQALYVLHQLTSSSLENAVSISLDQGKNWETIKPSTTGLKNAYNQPLYTFGAFSISDSGVFVADIGFGRIAVRGTDKTWHMLNLQVTATSFSVVGDTLYLPAVKGYEGKLVALDLTKLNNGPRAVASLPESKNGASVFSLANGNLSVGYDGFLSLINPSNFSQSSVTIGKFSLGYLSDDGFVGSASDGSWQVYDSNFRLLSSFKGGNTEDLAYQYLNGCVFILHPDSFDCTGSSSYDLPVSLAGKETVFAGAVLILPVSRPLPVSVTATSTPVLDPVLFVSGLGGGNDGDLYWEGKNPDKVSLVTKSGLEFRLSISVWKTGQQGYFLTFDHYLTQDICLMAEMVGRSVDYIRTRTHSEKIDLIGYSMGGLLSRCFVENLVPSYTYDNSVDDLLLIAVPNNGSFVASFSGPLIFFGDLIKGFQASGLTSYSPLIKHINGGHIPDSIRTTVIFGGGLWLPILEHHDGLVSGSDTRLEQSVQKSARYIYLANAVHANRFALGSRRYPILEDQIHLTDTIRQMGENKGQ